MISTCLSIGDVSFDRLFKVLSARFRHCKVSVFPFVNSACLMGRRFERVHIFCLSLFPCLSILASVDDVCLQHLLQMHLPNELD